MQEDQIKKIAIGACVVALLACGLAVWGIMEAKSASNSLSEQKSSQANVEKYNQEQIAAAEAKINKRLRQEGGSIKSLGKAQASEQREIKKGLLQLRAQSAKTASLQKEIASLRSQQQADRAKTQSQIADIESEIKALRKELRQINKAISAL